MVTSRIHLRFFVLLLGIAIVASHASLALAAGPQCDLEALQYNGESIGYTILGGQYTIGTAVTSTAATFTVNGATSPALSLGQSATVGKLSLNVERVGPIGSKQGVYFCAASTVKVACTDSDGGANYGVQGTAQNALGSRGMDFCTGRVLTEWACSSNGNVLSSTYTCPYGCNNGACLSATTVCYSGMQYIPAKCTGGTITQDVTNGCRTITCTAPGSSLKVQACDKPDQGTKQYFEMYKQSQAGTAVSKICLGTTCISDNGYAKSPNFPVCLG